MSDVSYESLSRYQKSRVDHLVHNGVDLDRAIHMALIGPERYNAGRNISFHKKCSEEEFGHIRQHMAQYSFDPYLCNSGFCNSKVSASENETE